MKLEEATRRNKYTMGLRAVDIPYNFGDVYYARPKKAIRMQGIIRATSDRYGIKRSSMMGPARSDCYAHPRQLAMLLCRELLPHVSVAVIGRIFARDHTTILHGIKAARKRMSWCNETRDAYEAIRRVLGEPADSPRATRLCMSCGKPFPSSGLENRLCSEENCKARRQFLSSSLAP